MANQGSTGLSAMWRVYRAYADLRRITLAQTTSMIGDWAGVLVLSLLVLERTGSAGYAGLIIGTSRAVQPLGALLVSPFGDRLPRKWVMFSADLIRAACYLVVVLWYVPVWFIVILVAIEGVATNSFNATQFAIRGDITQPGKSEYKENIKISAIVQNLGMILGLIAGVSLRPLLGTEPALLINAGSFLISAGLIARLEKGAVRPADTEKATVRMVFQTYREAFSERYVRHAVLIASVGIAGFASIEQLVVVYTERSFMWANAELAAAPLGILSAIAAIIATVRMPSDETLTADQRLKSAAGLLLVTTAFALIILVLPLPTVIEAVLLFGAVGASFGAMPRTMDVAGETVLQTRHATVFGALISILTCTLGFSITITGWLVEHYGVTAGFSIILVASSLYCVYAMIDLQRSSSQASALPVHD